ncbi:hypothetical protein CYG68_17345 [Morganella morganii]|uniref:Uncharacterized protein n=1 Tax=Morganella morganii TaxID=582 RepID=A0A8I0UA05_MORMO|nr:hypothetical protein [Morganella morganii]MBE8614143.1 hypothetical protein [Morganella morganii]
MKVSLNHLIILIIICAMSFSLIFVFSEWILTDKSILELEWRSGFEIGSMIGGCAGAAIWLIYKFNIR